MRASKERKIKAQYYNKIYLLISVDVRFYPYNIRRIKMIMYEFDTKTKLKVKSHS